MHYGDCRAPDAETEECDRRVSSLLLRNSGKADGGTMAIAVRRMLKLREAKLCQTSLSKLPQIALRRGGGLAS